MMRWLLQLIGHGFCRFLIVYHYCYRCDFFSNLINRTSELVERNYFWMKHIHRKKQENTATDNSHSTHSCLTHMFGNNWYQMSLCFRSVWFLYLIWFDWIWCLFVMFFLSFTLIDASQFIGFIFLFHLFLRHRKPERIHITLWNVKLWSSPDSC